MTKKRKVCPICKRKVGPSSNDSSDSDSERVLRSVTNVITRENDPLLRHEHPVVFFKIFFIYFFFLIKDGN